MGNNNGVASHGVQKLGGSKASQAELITAFSGLVRSPLWETDDRQDATPTRRDEARGTECLAWELEAPNHVSCGMPLVTEQLTLIFAF